LAALAECGLAMATAKPARNRDTAELIGVDRLHDTGTSLGVSSPNLRRANIQSVARINPGDGRQMGQLSVTCRHDKQSVLLPGPKWTGHAHRRGGLDGQQHSVVQSSLAATYLRWHPNDVNMKVLVG
jgi:hypothetical protein